MKDQINIKIRHLVRYWVTCGQISVQDVIDDLKEFDKLLKSELEVDDDNKRKKRKVDNLESDEQE